MSGISQNAERYCYNPFCPGLIRKCHNTQSKISRKQRKQVLKNGTVLKQKSKRSFPATAKRF